MKKSLLTVLVAVALLAFAVIAEAQQQTKVAKIGTLSFRSASALSPGRDLLRRELRAFGYAEGKNIVFEIRSAEGKFDRFPALAEELVRLNVDVFVASSMAEARAFKNASKTIPIVFYNVDDPIAAELIDSLARPGGNITGVTNITSVLAGKRLELLKETIPKLSRVAVLWNPADEGSAGSWKESQLPARALGLQLHSMEVDSTEKLEGAFKEA